MQDRLRWRVAWVFGLVLCASMMPEAIAESDALAALGKSATDGGVTTMGTDSRVCLVRHDSKASLDKASATSGGISFGAKSSVSECVDACAANPACVQTIYDKAKGECYSTKGVTKGAGDGAGFTMMRCSKAPHLPTTKVCRIHKAQQLTSTDKQYQMDFKQVKYGAKAKTEEECLMPCTLMSACSQSAWSTKEQKCYPAKKASLLFSKKHGSGGYTIIQCVSNTPSAAAKEATAKAAAADKQTAEKAKLAAEITQEKAKNEQKKKLLSQKQAANGAAEVKKTATAVKAAKTALANAKTDAEKKTAQENLKKAEKASADAQKASAAEKVKADKAKKEADASKTKAEAAKKKVVAQESPKAQKADAKAQKEAKKVEEDQKKLQKLEATEKDAVAQVSVALKTQKADKIAAAKKTHVEAKDKLAKFKVQIAQAKLAAQKAKLKAEQEAEKKTTTDKAAEVKKTAKAVEEAKTALAKAKTDAEKKTAQENLKKAEQAAEKAAEKDAGKKKGGGQKVQPSEAEAKKALEAEKKAQLVAKALAAEKRKEVTQELADKAEGKQKVAESGVKIEVVKQQLKKVKATKRPASQKRKMIKAKKAILAKAALLQKTRKGSLVKLQKVGKEQAMDAAQAKESSKKAKLAAQTAKNQLSLSRRASEKRMKSDQWYSKGALLFAQGVKYQGLLKQYQDAHNQLEAYQYNSELKTYVKAFPKGFTAPLRDAEAAPSKLIPAGSDSNLLKPGSVVVLQGGKRRRYCSDDEGSVKCDKKSFGKKEKFQVVSAKKGKVALKSVKSGKFCRQSGNKFSCSQSTIRKRESFKVHAADGGRIAFQAHNGRYCTDYGSKIRCSAKVVKRTQMFTAKCIKSCD